MISELEKTIQNRIELLDAIIKAADEQMPNVEGHLRVGYTGKFPKYYHILDTGDKQGSYIRKNEMDLIRNLAQKSYNTDIASLAQEERDFLSRMITAYPDKTFDQYMDSLVDARKSVINPIWLPDEDYKRRWLSQKYQGRGFSPDDHSQFITNSGLRVRSKSEVNIANSLDRRKLPYLYKFPVYLEGFGWVYPDFVILLIESRTIVIWEHHGLLDDQDYRENKFLRKNNAYIANGYFPGKNLIQTFESKKTPLSIPTIEAMIDVYLV